MTLRRIDFPVLARGMDREAPRGALGTEGARMSAEGPLWREMVNLVPHEGELRRREAVVPLDGIPDDFDSTAALLIAEVAPGILGFTPGRWLIVTAKEIYLGSAGAWTNLTPVHATGTVAVTNGTTGVTGTSTAWLTRGIGATQQIELPSGSGDWYTISSVNSDTSITLTANYTGTTLSGDDYVIRRTGFAAGVSLDGAGLFPFAATLNGDLYIAADISGGLWTAGGINIGDGAVIKIAGGANSEKTSFSAASDVTFLTSGKSEVESGVDNLGYFISIRGLTVLSDGRLVILTAAWDDVSDETFLARVHYSSLTNLAVWTSSPGGFTDLVDFDGAATALTGGANRVHVHLTNGIIAGDLTGAQDPPLRFRPTDARIGAAGPRTVVRVPGGRALPPGDLFIGNDHRFYTFNGGEASVVEWVHCREDISDLRTQAIAWGFFRLDLFRGYAGFIPRQFAVESEEFRLYYESGDYVRCVYPGFHVTAAATPLANLIDASSAPAGRGYFGGEGTSSGGSLLYEVRDDLQEDDTEQTVAVTLSTLTVSAKTDFFTDPSRKWAIERVEIMAEKTASDADALTIRIVRDDGDQADEVVTSTVSGSAGIQRAYAFYPTQRSARWNQIQVTAGTAADGNLFEYRLSSMSVWVADVGEARTG